MTPLSLEAQFGEIASYIALVIEAGAVLVVSFGAVQAFATVVVSAVRGGAERAAGVREDISKLAVIATILTMLNYFLAKDIAEFDSVRDASGNPPAT